MNYLRLINKKIITFSKIHFNRLIKFSLFTFLLLLLSYPNAYFNQVKKGTKIFLPKNILLPPPPPYPVNRNISEPPKISTAGIYVLDIPSNVVLYEKNSREKFFPASTTKIMTALVALDHYKLDDVLTVKTVMNEGRKMGLVSGEKLTFEALLYGSLIHSASDATYTIAENYSGGVENFVTKMNEKATSLYLSDTHFTNPIGFDDPNHYTTARDLAKLARVAIQNRIFAKTVSTKSITVSDVTYTYFHSLTNVNELLGRVAGVSGIKTGFTQTAGETLVSEVKKNGDDVLFVVLKSQDRFGETEKLIDWVFENFTWKPISEVTPVPVPTNVKTVQGFTPASDYQLPEGRQQNYYPPQKQI